MSTSIDERWSEYDEEDDDELDTSDEDYRGDDRNDDPPDETNEEDTLHPDVSKNLLDWHEGRRVVELGVLAAQLQKGCKKCGTVLHLCDCFQERHYGLGSILYIKCTICSFISNIPTGKRHEKNIWDVNTKLGAGITSSGIGFSNLQMLFASLNIPGVAAGTVKKRDREAGKAIESVAKKSCNEALDEEIKLNDGKVEIRVAADAGWQTRSSGRKYNSYSGHSSLIGDKSGKIVRYDYRCRKCRLCENAKRKGIQPIDHDCR
ncbi:uncharacterized protein LOC134232508 [Saccostrea cucullata]|uniref:uncharacterized protein LOC134232508 n=1 Tax=Saccostrea cuccullata TaxID=36930 RepID=UPI002ED1C486